MSRRFIVVCVLLSIGCGVHAQSESPKSPVVVDELALNDQAQAQKRREEIRETLKGPVYILAPMPRQLSNAQRAEMRQQVRQQRPEPTK